MKIAAAPCSFTCYNKDNPTGSDPARYYVSSCSFSAETGPTSEAVSGDLYIDGVAVSASVSVVSFGVTYSGNASFVFPALHWAFSLDGHATLAETDTVTEPVDLTAIVAGAVIPGTFALTAELVASGQAVYEDWSQT